MKALFRDGTTLKLLADFFNKLESTPYRNILSLLEQRLDRYYKGI